MLNDAEIRGDVNNLGILRHSTLIDAIATLTAHGFEVAEYHCVGNRLLINAIWVGGTPAGARVSTSCADGGTPVAVQACSATNESFGRSGTAAALVLAQLTERTATYCPPLSVLLKRLFECPDSCRESPETFAAQAGISRRTLDRYVSRAGIRSTRLLFAGARACVAFSWLRERSRSKRRIGEALGCASFRPIERQCRSLTGLEITKLEQIASELGFAELITTKLLEGDRHTSNDIVDVDSIRHSDA